MKKIIAGIIAVIGSIYTLGIIGAADTGASNSYFIPRAIIGAVVAILCILYINNQQNHENKRRNRRRGTNRCENR